MTGRAPITIALLFAAACAPAARMDTEPVPVTDTVVTAAMEQLEARRAPAQVAEAAPEAARPERPARESAGTVAMLEHVEAPPPAPAAASWDIEVKEYLAHDRVEF